SRSSAPSTARCIGPPSATGPFRSTTWSGPSTRNSMPHEYQPSPRWPQPRRRRKRDDGGVISESAVRRPATRLRPYIRWFTGYPLVGGAPARPRGPPSPFLTMIATLDAPLIMLAHPDPATPPGAYDTLVGGLHTGPAMITHDGRRSNTERVRV